LPAEAGCFDLITLTGVLEHIQDVRATIASLVRLCSSGGKILLEVPDAMRYAEFVHSPFQDFNTEHINHFSRESLRNLMRQFGMTLFREEHIEVRGPSGLALPALLCVFERVEETIAGRWSIDPAFRESIQRYIDISRKMMESLNQQVLNALAASQKIIVWGTGQLAMKMLSDTALKDADIVAFVDANPIHSGRTIQGRPILLPQDLPHGELPILITSLLHAEGILRVIQDLGLTNPVIVLQPGQRVGSSLQETVQRDA
jgi:hypothetical protein